MTVVFVGQLVDVDQLSITETIMWKDHPERDVMIAELMLCGYVYPVAEFLPRSGTTLRHLGHVRNFTNSSHPALRLAVIQTGSENISRSVGVQPWHADLRPLIWAEITDGYVHAWYAAVMSGGFTPWAKLVLGGSPWDV